MELKRGRARMVGRGRGVVVRLDGVHLLRMFTTRVLLVSSTRPIVGPIRRETTPDVPVILSQFARKVAAAMLEMERTRHEKIHIQRDVTSVNFKEAMKEFRKMNPLSFDGLGDPVVVGHCLSQIRKIFDTVSITEDDMKADFESTFKDQYFPEAYRDELKDQFEKLVQGDMKVSEYAIKFQSLSRFAPDFQRIRNFFDLLDCAIRVKPKKGQRKEFKGSWGAEANVVGHQFYYLWKFQQERDREMIHRDQLGNKCLVHQF
ncbi:hypothetical protein Acr_11g0011100 [Actinidia rufa]|uniref:Retrotransposon gag domain-containing protein n=1 Tax=Actinidia rufa TaxID=165716 RepID=A0A7J0FDM6_9ERIC|nr:hypothetical protein Acr_11g0011100 [Actinidia rufa]